MPIETTGPGPNVPGPSGEESLLALARSVLSAQPFSQLMQAKLEDIQPGRAVLSIDLEQIHLQQFGQAHGGAIAYLIDNAITFAAGSIAGPNVVTSEFKLSYLRPANKGTLKAEAWVEHSGKQQVVCRCEVKLHCTDQSPILCALGLGTIALMSS